MDTDITNVIVKKLDENILNFIEEFGKELRKLRNLKDENSDDTEIKKQMDILKDYIENNELSPHIKENNTFWSTENIKDGTKKGYAVSFIDANSNAYDYTEISSGTKQMFHLLLLTLSTFHQDEGILLFDEIEVGLHMDVITEYLEYVNKLIKNKRDSIQLIASTHQEKLLDLPFISRESIILIKKHKKTAFIDYLSNYSIRKDQTVSKRYSLDAFETNPKIDGLETKKDEISCS